MLRRIVLKNFKCFEALDLPCAPLNLLCGLNGMGKSSVIQGLLVLRQSFDTGDLSQGRLVLGGALTDLGAGSDVLFKDAEEEVVGFELRRDETPEPWTQTFGYSRTGDQLTVNGPAAEAGVPPVWRAFPPFGGGLAYLQAERIGPRKSYPLSEMLARRGNLGARGEFAWNYLNDRQNDRFPADDPGVLDPRDSRIATRGVPGAPRRPLRQRQPPRRRRHHLAAGMPRRGDRGEGSPPGTVTGNIGHEGPGAGERGRVHAPRFSG